MKIDLIVCILLLASCGNRNATDGDSDRWSENILLSSSPNLSSIKSSSSGIEMSSSISLTAMMSAAKQYPEKSCLTFRNIFPSQTGGSIIGTLEVYKLSENRFLILKESGLANDTNSLADIEDSLRAAISSYPYGYDTTLIQSECDTGSLLRSIPLNGYRLIEDVVDSAMLENVYEDWFLLDDDSIHWKLSYTAFLDTLLKHPTTGLSYEAITEEDTLVRGIRFSEITGEF